MSSRHWSCGISSVRSLLAWCSATAAFSRAGPSAPSTGLARGFNPTGTVTFRLFGPDNTTCDPGGAAAVFTSTVNLTAGAASLPAAFGTTAAGTYSWVAIYSGDGNNNAFASAAPTSRSRSPRGLPASRPPPRPTASKSAPRYGTPPP